MERKQITFDTFIRSIMGAVIVVGIVMLLNRLSGVLVPFFLAWLVSYLLFPLVKFFQYRCHMKYRILAILSAFLVTGVVLTGVFMLMIPLFSVVPMWFVVIFPGGDGLWLRADDTADD